MNKICLDGSHKCAEFAVLAMQCAHTIKHGEEKEGDAKRIARFGNA